MRERDSLSRLLATHGRSGEDDRSARSRHASLRGSARLLDDEAKARLLDASLGVLAAFRTLADVAEDILRERRASLFESRVSGPVADASRSDDVDHPVRPGAPAREQIPLTY